MRIRGFDSDCNQSVSNAGSDYFVHYAAEIFFTSNKDKKILTVDDQLYYKHGERSKSDLAVC